MHEEKRFQGNKIFMVECWTCEEGMAHVGKEPNGRMFCEVCKDIYLTEKEENLARYVELKIELMYERALRNMEKQGMPMSVYKEAAESVHEFAKEDSTKFDSTPEMMAAIELIHNRIPIKLQYPIQRYRVDIIIPSMKVALEIDGHTHKYNVLKDSIRDTNLIEEFGIGWEVVRIPVKHIESNLRKLIPAIKAVYQEKQKLRRNNNGFIPKHFSNRDRALQDLIEEQNG